MFCMQRAFFSNSWLETIKPLQLNVWNFSSSHESWVSETLKKIEFSLYIISCFGKFVKIMPTAFCFQHEKMCSKLKIILKSLFLFVERIVNVHFTFTFDCMSLSWSHSHSCDGKYFMKSLSIWNWWNNFSWCLFSTDFFF